MSVFRNLLMNLEEKEPYLLGDGTEYINSNFVPINHSVEIKFALSNNFEARLGAYQMSFKYYYPLRYNSSNNTLSSAFVDSDFVPWDNPDYNITLMNTFDTKKHTVLYNETNNHYLYFDGILKKEMTGFKSFTTSPANTSLLIFAECTYYSSSYPTNIEKSSYKLYSLKFKNNDTGVVEREYVPAINNGVACLYEKIQGQYYYGNDGGSSFVYGKD